MIKIFVDSASSIRKAEAEKLGIELISIRLLLNNIDYEDGNLDIDSFYKVLLATKEFPKTSLPNLLNIEDRIREELDKGNEVLVITLSSKISGSNSAIKSLFDEDDKVYVYDSMAAVGAERILVYEALKYKDTKSMAEIIKILDDLRPRIVTAAIPETLEYLHRGGRLSKSEYLLGSVLHIKPVIGFKDGGVHLIAKKLGLNKAKAYLKEVLKEADLNYPIVPSYTYRNDNLEDVIKTLDEKTKASMIEEDNLSPSIATHWGPNAFGFIFVKKN